MERTKRSSKARAGARARERAGGMAGCCLRSSSVGVCAQIKGGEGLPREGSQGLHLSHAKQQESGILIMIIYLPNDSEISFSKSGSQ